MAGVAFAALLVVLVVLAARSVPRLLVLTLAWAGGTVLAAGLLFTHDDPGGLLMPWVGGRYFLLPGFALAAVALVAASRKSRAGLALCALLVVGLVGDFALIDPPDLSWPAASACIGSPAPCDVPVNWNMTLVWPGSTH